MNDPQYLVRRLGWHQSPHGDSYTRRLPTAETVARFESFDEAEYDRRRREDGARDGENPFRFGGATLFFQTSLDAPRLHDWLLDGGIDPPLEQHSHRAWREWWDAFAHTWSEEQRNHAWLGLDKVRFFDVVEESPLDLFHVVVELQYATAGYQSQYLDADREGGVPAGVYRSRRTAAAACERWNQERQRDNRYRGYYYLRLVDRPGYADRGEFGAVPDSLFFEVADIPGNVQRHAGVGYLLQRRAFDRLGRGCHNRQGEDTGSRVPLRLFASRAEANGFRDGLIAAARQVVNPFQVFTPLMAGRTEQDLIAAIEQSQPPLPWPVRLQLELWREWWDLCQDEITDDQRNAAWELFEDQPLFEVLRVEVNED
jgi:hypothetical protein